MITETRPYGGVVVVPPPPGTAVMPCEYCDRMLAADGMRRVGDGPRADGSPILGHIVCPKCQLRAGDAS